MGCSGDPREGMTWQEIERAWDFDGVSDTWPGEAVAEIDHQIARYIRVREELAQLRAQMAYMQLMGFSPFPPPPPT